MNSERLDDFRIYVRDWEVTAEEYDRTAEMRFIKRWRLLNQMRRLTRGFTYKWMEKD